MADPTLHGNGYPCPACALRREIEDKTQILRPGVPCNVCNDSGRLGYSEAEIVARTVEEARRLHWPDFERRTGGRRPECPRCQDTGYLDHCHLSIDPCPACNPGADHCQMAISSGAPV